MHSTSRNNPSWLIRDNKSVSPEMRDPEKIIGRMQHFWAGHGNFGNDFTSPYEKGLIGKRFSISNFKGTHRNDYSRAEMPFEGSVNPLHREALFDLVYHGPYDLDNPKYDELMELYDAARFLEPVQIRKDNTDDATGSTLRVDNSTVPASNQNRGIPQAYSEALRTRRTEVEQSLSSGKAPFTRVKPGQVANAVRNEVSERGVQKVINNYPEVSDPRFVRVMGFQVLGDGGVTGDVRDVIDLSTGTWAKISPDQFFPH